MSKRQEILNQFLITKDPKIRNEIIKENIPLVKQIIQRKFQYPNLEDDMLQAGLIGINKALNSYDPNKGKFSTVAYQAITNNIIMMLKKDQYEYGSFHNKRTRVDDEDIINNLTDDNKSIGLMDTVNQFLPKMPLKDQYNLNRKFGFKSGKINYFQGVQSLNRFKKLLRVSGIRRADFYN
jgi:RNA polymerase sigma factor (sigma-70 family)